MDSATNAAKKIYVESRGVESGIYNGVEFKEYRIRSYDIGIPFFLTRAWLQGRIHYDGQIYDNLNVLYDLVRDKVIIEHTKGHFKLELINEKIDSFSIIAPILTNEIATVNSSEIQEHRIHNFVKLIPDSASNSILKTGFYDLLYNGKIKVYVKRKKDIQTTTDARLEITTYQDKSQFFIYKDEKYFLVKSKGSVLKVFAERKNMLRKHLSEHKIKFSKNREYALVESAKFYENSGK